MPLVRSTARPMLASMFITGGLDAVLHPERKARCRAQGRAQASPAGCRSRMPEDPVQLVRINGAVQLVAGLSLATGRIPRLSALALAGSLVPTTLAGHRFWEKSDKAERKTQQQQFTKNLSMLGGLILAAVDLEGRPGIRHRGHDAVRELKHAGHDLQPARRRRPATGRRRSPTSSCRSPEPGLVDPYGRLGPCLSCRRYRRWSPSSASARWATSSPGSTSRR